MKRLLAGLAGLIVAACATDIKTPEADFTDVTIFRGEAVLPMTGEGDHAEAIAIRDGIILSLGTEAELSAAYPGAQLDLTFADMTIMPGLIDPHMHVLLASMMYAQPFAPPWPMAMPDGMSKGYPSHAQFMDRLAEIVATAPDDGTPIIVYGYHNLLQGDLDRSMLDSVAAERPLIVWHYSGHDFYLNSPALSLIGATPDWAEAFHGVDLTPEGELTGRIYEDAAFRVFMSLGAYMAAPDVVARGADRYFDIVRGAGVTTTADMGYGVFGLPLENAAIGANWSMEGEGFRLYLVPEFRSFGREFGADAPQAVLDMVSGDRPAPAPVLPRVKYFTDAAYYSQTMRLSPPGYLSGQSQGSEGLWVIEPDQLVSTMLPYIEKGLGVHIHSNGDAAQSATLGALEELRAKGYDVAFVIEHGGLFSPEQIKKAAELDAMISAASHYVYYLSGAYAGPLGPMRANWITPLGGLSREGVVVTVHSDAPLAPPIPLRAASAHVTRLNMQGNVYVAEHALTPYDALEAITLDAARILGLDQEIGSLEPGKKADFTILEDDPFIVDPKNWAAIPVWGVVLAGEKRPLE